MYPFKLGAGRRLGVVALAVAMTGAAWDQRAALAVNVLLNPGFETDAVLNQAPVPIVTDWTGFNGVRNTTSAPNDPVHTGIGSLQLVGAGGFAVPLVLQSFDATPGQTWDLQAYIRVEQAFTGGTRALVKIVFRDLDLAMDLQPAAVNIGVADPDANFPGVIPDPQVTSTSAVGQWHFSRAQGVAPAGTDQVTFFALLVDATAGTVYFDDFAAELVVPSVVGDFDDDLDVDTTDFNTWKAAFGQTAAGDADNDNDSDGKDFLLWQANFGTTPGATAAAVGVPEPASAALASAVLALAAARFRRWA